MIEIKNDLNDAEKQAEEKIKGLLYEIFRLDFEDLDFGIYRILNIKKKEIENFINEKLIQLVEKEFKELSESDRNELYKKINEKKNEIRSIIGDNAFDESGNLKEAYATTNLGKDYISLLNQARNIDNSIQDKIEIFSRIYEFFERYYADGDLIPIRRYTRTYDYIIPYNGEEVALYWANKEQYYVKTAEYFYKYTFAVERYEINFRLKEAQVDKNNVKGKDKYFILLDNNFLEVSDRIINIYFEYRELTESDYKKYNFSGKEPSTKIKETLISDAVDRINAQLAQNNNKVVIKLNEKFKKINGELSNKTVLRTHLEWYITRNTKDYFIYKNLKKFFLTEMDFYIKNEMLPLDNVDETNLNRSLKRIKVFKDITTNIIDFLDQIESFEVKLWEKRKFVLSTEYVITLDKIMQYAGEEFLDEILKNDKQLQEWKELFNVEVKRKEDLIKNNTLLENEYKKLPIDTKYFSPEFKWKLLGAITKKYNLDDILDGILIKSENWQALNLLLNKYREKVQTIYIDPPFNKDQEANYLYKVKYKDSTWATMLENRISLGRELLNERGSIFVRCDYNGNWIVRPLMDEVFGKENFRNEIVVKRGAPKAGLFLQFGNLKSIGVMYDNLYWFSKEQEKVFGKFAKTLAQERKGYWTSFKKIYDRPTMRYEILGINLIEGQWMWNKERAYKAVENYQKYLEISKKTNETLEEYWIRTGKKLEFVRRKRTSIQYWVPPKEVTLLDNNWLDIPGYSQGWGFKTENSEILLKRVIESTSNKGDLVMDFFLGSGTTTAVAHKLGRKWIGIEMGEHFYTVVLPRMKKVLAYDKSGISNDEDVKEIYNENTPGGFFKYQVLEQYEDTLNNIEFAGEKSRLSTLDKFEDYIFHILEYETRGSVSRLNIDKFKNPFEYKMRVFDDKGIEKYINVDMIETFNYLMGLTVKKLFAENYNEHQYIWVIGELSDKAPAVVIWRNAEELNPIDDKHHIEEKLKDIMDQISPHVYINSDSAVENAIPIEVEFMKHLGG